MSDSKVVVQGGFPIFGVLGVVFVTLKLLGITAVAGWSWWWVTAPFWGPAAAVLLFAGVVILGGLLIGLVSGLLGTRK